MYAFFIKALLMFGENLLIALVGEATIKWVFFKIAHYITKLTKTTVDDEFVDEIEKNYGKK